MKKLIKKSDQAKQKENQKITLRLNNTQIARLESILRDYKQMRGPSPIALILDLDLKVETGEIVASDIITRVRTDYK